MKIGRMHYSENKRYCTRLEYDYDIPRYVVYKIVEKTTFWTKKKYTYYHKIDEIYLGTCNRSLHHFNDALQKAMSLCKTLESIDVEK